MSKRFIKWSVKEINGKFGSFLNVSIHKDDFATLPDTKWYVRITINANKNWPDQYGNTHYMTLNEREPKEQNEAQRATKDDIDLPF